MPLLEQALAALPDEDSALRVRLLARLASGPLRDPSLGQARKHAMSTEALDMARRLGDPQTLAYAITGYISSVPLAGLHAEQLELAAESLELATAAATGSARRRRTSTGS